MEITLLQENSIRIKGKLATFVVDPKQSKAKTPTDATIFLHDSSNTGTIEGSRLSMSGPGEYEIGGVKISALRHDGSVMYYLSIDGMTVLLAVASGLKGKENIRDTQVAILYADGLVEQSALATAGSTVALFYGPQAVENIKMLGKESQPINKYVTTKDKLPSEMEAVLLQ